MRVALDAALEKDLREICRAAVMNSWTPYEHDHPGNQTKAARLEVLAERLDGIRTTYSLGEGPAAQYLTQAQRQMREWAEAIRAFPNTDLDRSLIAAIPLVVEIRMNQVLDAHRGIQQLPGETAGRLDSMVEQIRKAGDHLRHSKPEEALKAMEQLLRGAREFRTDLVKQVERGLER